MHIYSPSSSYQVYYVSLTTGSTSCSYKNSQVIIVSLPQPALNCSMVSANFYSTIAANTVTFMNTSSPQNTYSLTNYWDYGDGTNDSAFSPHNHCYTTKGIFTVKLKSKWEDSLGTRCYDSISRNDTLTTYFRQSKVGLIIPGISFRTLLWCT